MGHCMKPMGGTVCICETDGVYFAYERNLFYEHREDYDEFEKSWISLKQATDEGTQNMR